MDSSITDRGSSRTITAFFDSRDDAQAALDRLDALGLPDGSAKLVRGNDATAENGDNEHRGFWESLSDFFFPDDDRAAYAEGLRRGGFLVTAKDIPADKYDEALDILDDEGSVDVDARSSEWRSEGWSGTSYGDGAPFERSAASATDLSMAGTGVGASAFSGGKMAGGGSGYDADRDVSSTRAGTDEIGTSSSLASRNAAVGETDLTGVGGPAMSDGSDPDTMREDRALNRDEAPTAVAPPIDADSADVEPAPVYDDLDQQRMTGRRDMSTGRARARTYAFDDIIDSETSRGRATEVEVEDERSIGTQQVEAGTRR